MRKKSISSVHESQNPARQFVYQRSNQKEGSSYYIFLYSEDDQSEDENQFPLKIRGTKISPRKIQVINVKVQSEDTLQALALRYDCTISELKRINNIHKDNEIHAHQTIKVPVQPYSLLTETIKKKNQDKDVDVDAKNELGGIVSGEKEVINLVGTPTCSTSSTIEINSIILNSIVEPLPQSHSESCQITDQETDQLISSNDSNTTVRNNFVNTFKCSGDDWGLSWFQLLCFSLLLGFAGPIIYILYIAESSKYHNSS